MDLCIKAEKLKNDLIQILNESNVSIALGFFILKDVLNEVQIIFKEEIEKENNKENFSIETQKENFNYTQKDIEQKEEKIDDEGTIPTSKQDL